MGRGTARQLRSAVDVSVESSLVALDENQTHSLVIGQGRGGVGVGWGWARSGINPSQSASLSGL